MYYVWLEPNWNDFCVISLRFEWKGIENMTLFNTIWVMKFLLFVLALGPISVSVSQSRQASRKCEISRFNFYYTYVSKYISTNYQNAEISFLPQGGSCFWMVPVASSYQKTPESQLTVHTLSVFSNLHMIWFFYKKYLKNLNFQKHFYQKLVS